jgi:hypothetical protein
MIIRDNIITYEAIDGDAKFKVYNEATKQIKTNQTGE